MKILEILAWPGAVVVLGIIFFFVFKKPISSLLDRTEKVGKDGISAKPSRPQQPAEPKPEDQFDDLMKGLDSVMLREQERRIEDDLKNNNISDPAKQVQLLVRYLAGTQIHLLFERLYYVMYGSQIMLVQYLNTCPNGDTETNLVPYHEDCMKRLGITENYPFEKYIGYLTTSVLVVLEGDRYRITQRGIEFLEYLVKQGYTPYKAG